MKWDDRWVNMSLIKQIYLTQDIRTSDQKRIYKIRFAQGQIWDDTLTKVEFETREEAQDYLDDRMNSLRS